ncbi:thioredoxin family protein [Clostridium sp.]|uniref:thioredoxin family protein n=1 Tax=Clostridium sp. TaxID=1506 RepID=UPI00262AEA42|nr:thioredoxin family protein [Clostridium sp.]
MEKEILKSKITILYFSGATCGACEVIKRKINKILVDYKEVNFIEINGVEEKEIAAKYDVFTLPLVILFIEGKESLRIGRNIDILDFKNSIDRYYNLLY